MQPQSELNLQLKPGSPASAVPRKWFMFINNVLRFLTVQNGRLIANNDKWTLVCGGGAGVWSGYYWFGGQENGPLLDELSGKYFGVHLRTGDYSFSDAPFNQEDVEWRYVADKDEETGAYTLSNRTCGDIIIRIT